MFGNQRQRRASSTRERYGLATPCARRDTHSKSSRSCDQMRPVVRRRKSAPPSTSPRQTPTVLRQAASVSAVHPSLARKSMSAPTCVSTSRMSPHRLCLAARQSAARPSLHRTFASQLPTMALEQERHRAAGGGMFSATSSSPGGCMKCASVGKPVSARLSDEAPASSSHWRIRSLPDRSAPAMQWTWARDSLTSSPAVGSGSTHFSDPATAAQSSGGQGAGRICVRTGPIVN
jgi:hypothetical protein